MTQKVKRAPTDTNRVQRPPMREIRIVARCGNCIRCIRRCRDWVQKGCRSAGIDIAGMQAAGDQRSILAERKALRARARAQIYPGLILVTI